MTSAQSTRHERGMLLALLALAAGLRFVGLDWDQGFLLHPDERNLVTAASRLDLGELRDPGFYAYNGLLMYLDRLLAAGVALVSGDPSTATDPATLAWVGRRVSALASTLTVGLVFAASRGLGPGVAVAAAALLAFSPGAIQAAHFATTESLLVMLGMSVLLACQPIARGDALRPVHGLGTGAWLGLAIGTKTAGLAYLSMPAAALWLRLRQQPGRSLALGASVLAAAGAIAAAVSPHSVLAFDAFRESMAAERAVASGAREVFYTLSFQGTTPWLTPLSNLHWLAGPLVPVLGFVGLAALAWAGRDLRHLAPRSLLPLVVFAGAYFAYVGSWHAKFVRYLVPLLPALAIGAAFACGRLGAWRRLATGCVVLTTAVSGVALFGIYLRPDTRLLASRWLEAHARAGEVVASERQDVVLPLLTTPAEASGLRSVWLDGFATDSDANLARASETLASADWLVLTSRRVHSVTRAQPQRFPRTSALYRLIFAGDLGYELSARFESQPGLLGVHVPDDRAEETFRVFDHPTVLVFRNRRNLAPSEIQRAVLAEAGRSATR